MHIIFQHLICMSVYCHVTLSSSFCKPVLVPCVRINIIIIIIIIIINMFYVLWDFLQIK